MKRVILFLCVTLHILPVKAESPAAVQIVKEFGENLSNWCKTKDIRYCDAMLGLTKGAKNCRVSDRIITDNLSESFGSEQYDMQSFVTLFQKHIHNGLSVSFNNIRLEKMKELSKDEKLDLPVCISCDIQIDGAMKMIAKDLFYVRENKITAVTDYGYFKLLDDAYHYYIAGDYTKAFNVYWNLSNNCRDENIVEIAEGYLFYMLNKNQGCKHINNYVKKTWIASKIWSVAQFRGAHKYFTVFYKHPAAVLCPCPDKPFYFWNENLYHEESTSAYEMKVQLGDHDHPFFCYIQRWNKDHFSLNYNYGENWLFFKENDKLFEMLPYTQMTKKHYPLTRRYYVGMGREKRKYYIHTPTVKKEKDLWWFVDESGKNISSEKYLFAFPYDKRAGLALVKNKNGKWGYINKRGEYVITPKYEMGQELFSNGKTFVIRDNQLIQIDVEGNELMKFPGYSDMAVSPDNKYFIAYNCKTNYLDVFDFTGIIVSPDKISRQTISNQGAVFDCRDPNWVSCTMLEHKDLETYHRFIGEEIPNPERIGIEKMVDLGLSVKWAAWNVGANSTEEDGIHCGWGDPTGMDQTGKDYKKWKKEVVNSKTLKWISHSYGGPNPPANICGTSLDVARQQWGGGWRLPSVNEFLELVGKCTWQRVTYKGAGGYLITGPSGNSIFMKSMDSGYWTGELNPEWTDSALTFIDGKGPKTSSRAGGAPRSCWDKEIWRPCIRAVCE